MTDMEDAHTEAEQHARVREIAQEKALASFRSTGQYVSSREEDAVLFGAHMGFETAIEWQRSRPVSEPSEEAIEAATRILYLDHGTDDWGKSAPEIAERCEEVARDMLRAAAGVQGSGNSGENPEATR